MINDILNYLKSLCAAHPQFMHVDKTHPAYFEFDYLSMISAKYRNNTAMFVHRIRGGYTNNRGDYKTRRTLLAYNIVRQVKSKDLLNSRPELLDCLKYGEEFIEYMEKDLQVNPDCAIRTLLRHVDIDDITFEDVELTADGYTGIQFRIPIRTEIKHTNEFNPPGWPAP